MGTSPRAERLAEESDNIVVQPRQMCGTESKKCLTTRSKIPSPVAKRRSYTRERRTASAEEFEREPNLA